MRLISSAVFRLYGVSENLDENGEYRLEAFEDDAFNEDIDVGEIDEALNGLADASYGQGCCWYEVTDDSYESNGKIEIEINDDDRLEIQDITDKISIDSDHSRFYILADVQLLEYQWVVAEPKGAVYSG